MKPQFFIVGMPLDDSARPSAEAKAIIESCTMLIGETRRQTSTYLKRAGISASVNSQFFLDPPNPNEMKDLMEQLKQAAVQNSRVALMSDCGMPVLFDPGSNILQSALQLGFEIHSVPSATSWGTAMVASGWEPPFLVQGFLPRESQERARAIGDLKSTKHHVVLMETPYRFQKLMSELASAFPQKTAFLAWEISKPSETLLWGKLSELRVKSSEFKSGEFVLILQGLNQ